MGQYYDLPRWAYRRTETSADSDEPTTELGGAMSSKAFDYDGDLWKATAEGLGTGVSTGHLPQVTHWSVQFECVSDPEKGSCRGHIRDSDPQDVSDDDLRRALKRALMKRRES